jgi:hypothetical protein
MTDSTKLRSITNLKFMQTGNAKFIFGWFSDCYLDIGTSQASLKGKNRNCDVYSVLRQIVADCTKILLPTSDLTSVKSTHSTVAVKLFTISRSHIIFPHILLHTHPSHMLLTQRSATIFMLYSTATLWTLLPNEPDSDAAHGPSFIVTQSVLPSGSKHVNRGVISRTSKAVS